MKKKSVGIIGTVGVPAKYGGFETLAHQLVENLAHKIDLTVYSSGITYSKKDRVKRWKGANIKYIPLKANGVQSILYDFFSMLHAIIYCDVLLVLGVSGCIFLPFIKLLSSKKIIVNVDGIEWRRAKWKGWVKKFLRLSEQMAVRYADEIITDNAGLQDHVAKIYGIRSSLIEYGADHVAPVKIEAKYSEKYSFLNQPYAFKVCRIEPENNIHIVLEAFKTVKSKKLVLVGNWTHNSYGRGLLKEFGHIPNLHLLDPIYEQEELNVLRSNCSFYIHGHSAGGTNPSLVEAMFLGLPIIAFDVVYNKVTTEYKGVYFGTKEELLEQIISLDDSSLDALGFTMKSIADRRYTWSVISNKYAASLLEKEQQPVPTLPTKTPQIQVSNLSLIKSK